MSLKKQLIMRAYLPQKPHTHLICIKTAFFVYEKFLENIFMRRFFFRCFLHKFIALEGLFQRGIYLGAFQS